MLLLQACAHELERGQQVWSQVVASNALQAFRADPNGTAYLSALQHIWRIVLLLRAAADLHDLTQAARTQHLNAFEAASRQSMGAVMGEYSATLYFGENRTPRSQAVFQASQDQAFQDQDQAFQDQGTCISVLSLL